MTIWMMSKKWLGLLKISRIKKDAELKGSLKSIEYLETSIFHVTHMAI